MSFKIKFKNAAATLLLAASATVTGPVLADNSGAFVGGMLTSRVLNNMHQRTKAEQEQAYYAQQQSQQVQQAAPAAPAASSPTQSTEQKLDELNKLAAGGYITPAEYKTKKKAIIDAM